MSKLKIKKGDIVFVISGANKDFKEKRTVLKVFPELNKATVQGVNIVKRHVKPSAENPQGGIKEFEAPIHISNLSICDPKEAKPSKVGFRIENNKKVRFSKISGSII